MTPAAEIWIHAAGEGRKLTYDALYRLTSAVTNGSTNYPKWGLSWSYDRYGNLGSPSFASSRQQTHAERK